MSRSTKILDRLRTSSAEAGIPSRSDMYISDVGPIDYYKCRALIGFSQGCGGVPTPKDVEDFVHSEFGNRVAPMMASCRVHEKMGAVDVILVQNSATRDLREAASMTRLSTTTYADDNGGIWSVEDNGHSKFLVRNVEEDVAGVVEARRNRTAGRHAPRLDDPRLRTAVFTLYTGDVVKFYSKSGTIMEGSITSTTGTEVTISAGGGSHKVSRDAILDIVTRPADMINDQRNEARDFFTRAWGDSSLADKLVSRTTLDRNQGPGASSIPTKKS